MNLSQYLIEIEHAIATENDTHRRGALTDYRRHVESARDEQKNECMELAI